MKIPSDPVEREGFYNDLVQKCLCTREDRRSQYERLRNYFLFGSDSGMAPAKYNKIEPSIDLLTSFLFAVETTRFTIQLGAGVDKRELVKVPPLAQRINDKWQNSNADITVSLGITWALVYNTMLVKLVQRGKDTLPFLVEPHNFGVLREDVNMLSRQEAFAHVYYTTRSQLYRDLGSHPHRDEIITRLSARPRTENDLPAGVRRVITSAFYPTMTGNVSDVLSGNDMYVPHTEEELVEMQELWVWNDDENDYQIATLTDPTLVIYDRAGGDGLYMKGKNPFTQICPMPSTDYFWGQSQVQKLTTLQDMREHHLQQIDMLVDRAVDSPKAVQGMWGAVEEKDAALRKLGALISTQDPTAKVNEFKPQIPTDLWAIIREIDGMFDEAISLHNLIRGQGDVGVRSKGQTESLLRVGSSRPKKRALIVEDSLERIVTQYLQLDQAHDPQPLVDMNGQKFIAEQFTGDFMVKVDAHSSSPVFVEDQREQANYMLEAGIIDGESYLDIVQPQNVQLLKEKYKVMQAQRAAAEARQQAADALSGKGGGSAPPAQPGIKAVK